MEIGGWRRGRVIGRGSSATVSLATALDSGAVFAVKCAELGRSAILQREQRILSSLRSPYVVSCLGFDISSHGSTGGLYYNLFLEYAPRGSLSDEIGKQGGRLDEAAIRCYSCEILRGLVYLHSQGVVHCDVKGRNVLVGTDGHAKIADLGCARLIAQEDEEGLRGTPMFMAPEVARGEEQGPPADVWALGCTIIEMATGGPAWPGVSDPIAAIHRVAFSPDVPAFPSWLSGEGKDFLSKCLKRDPRERWTAEQLLQHEFVASSSITSPSKPDTDRRWVSPKSTLDLAFWETLPDQDEEPSQHPFCDPSARIQQLVSSSSPTWTWDDIWVAVRSTDKERGAAPSCPATESSSRDESLNSIMLNGNCVINSHSDCYSTSFAQVAEEEMQQFVSCKPEVMSSKIGYVSVSYGQNVRFEISYWICSIDLYLFRFLSLNFFIPLCISNASRILALKQS
ncbi:mitogen-activated protein kinase kinase kinase 18-like [Musa acuminata AAA Group]|uniref:mitogen-activated protein kinase kinase kinase 18-like n=1 Tax=Musa acuminata AAA Group TaxID=214697 RepID=UPI0031D3B8DC